jgi:hypothetical protein
MIRTGEIRESDRQIQFPLTILEPARLQSELKLRNASAGPSFTSNGIDLSGSQVLVGSLSALFAVGLLLWVIIRLWLFE